MALKGKSRSMYYYKDPGSDILSASSQPIKGLVEGRQQLVGCIPTKRWLEDENGKRQGITQSFKVAFLPDSVPLPAAAEIVTKISGGTVYKWLEKTTNFKDDVENGLEIDYNNEGKAVRVAPYKDGVLDGLLYRVDEDGRIKYSRWEKGDRVATDDEIRREWGETVEGLKYEKEMDKAGRSATLKKVLEAASKEDKKKALQEFHSKESPVGVKRRTALKFDR